MKEYLFGDEMLSGLRSRFKIRAEHSHQFIAKSCVAYLYHAHISGWRADSYDLASYAWDVWALHTVSVAIVPTRQVEAAALALSEAAAAFAGDDRSSNLSQDDEERDYTVRRLLYNPLYMLDRLTTHIFESTSI